ncbi:hypothetical protein PRK78_003468 [Emydomyces testavorans]|uniref:Uncharacterized protein n=1 Tax=Emydomyces testavorans TaxID=2070801 RepID=A0AAF0IIT4_9EURO|nr:hypothetical protein PRK78_003468 [Emydomyces testavorans]
MAFRLPSQVHQRQPSFRNASPRPASPAIEATSSNYSSREEDSQEWVLFAPESSLSISTQTHTTSTERTPRTIGRSQLSDFGSLGTALHSGTGDVDVDQEHDDLLEEDATELDSLDDGLHAFREPTTYEPAADQFQLHQSDPAILPAHDGRGTFSASNPHVQEQLWRHEQFNPRRSGEAKGRRRSSVQRHLDSIDEMQDRDMERERWQRIEQWRMEHSRELLQEIEKQTGRRRHSRAGRASHTTKGVGRQPSVAVESTSEAKATVEKNSEEEEPFWRRITRKLIRDLIGIDDMILTIIFGEALVEEVQEEKRKEQAEALLLQQQGKSTTVTSKSSIRIDTERPKDLDEMLKNGASPSSEDSMWQQRLLDRIARELGIFVHQLWEHPGAFTTYLNTSSSGSSDPTGSSTSKTSSTHQSRPLSSRSASYGSFKHGAQVSSPTFKPTLQDVAGSNAAALWGIEEEDPLLANRAQFTTSDKPMSSARPQSSHSQHDREYWERELDVKMVFRYFYKGLVGKIPFSNDGTCTPTASSQKEQEEQDPSLRAAAIRHHHPLVARADAHTRSHRRPLKRWQTSSSGTGFHSGRINTPASSARLGGPTSTPFLFHHVRRPSSSCASQSTLISSTKGPLGSGSSRPYWDIGGSVGSGSAVVTVGVGAGGMGSWGDV